VGRLRLASGRRIFPVHGNEQSWIVHLGENYLKLVRGRLTYANVVSTLALFLVLTGATAYAANQMAANSVGTRQLKANAVSTEKLRNGSVTAAKLAPGAVATAQPAAAAAAAEGISPGSIGADKIAAGAIGTDKLADASVTAAKLAPSVVQGGVVARVRGTQQVPWASGEFYPLANPTYTQPAGQNDLYVAAFQVKFSAACVQRRSADVTLFVDRGDPGVFQSIAGTSAVEDAGSGEVTATGQIRVGTIGDGMSKLAPTAPKQHTFALRMNAVGCRDAGGKAVANGATLVGAGIDVIGVR
jgi:uncharacterized low-complexity protein